MWLIEAISTIALIFMGVMFLGLVVVFIAFECEMKKELEQYERI